MKDVKDKNESSSAAASFADDDDGYDQIEEMPTIPIWSFEEEEVVFDHDDNDSNIHGHHHYPLGGPAEDSLLAATTRTSSCSSSWNDVLLSTTNSLLAVPSLLSKSPYSLERTTQKTFGEEDNNNMNTSDEEDPVESTKNQEMGMMAEEDAEDIPVEVPLDVHTTNTISQKGGTKADDTTKEENDNRPLSVKKNTRGLIYFGFYTVILLGLGMAIILLWNALSSSSDSSSSTNNAEANETPNIQTSTTAATTTDFFAVLPTIPSGASTSTRIATTSLLATTSTTTSSTTTTTTTSTGLPSQAPSAAPSSCQDFIAMDAICYLGSPPVTLLVNFANCDPLQDDWIGIYPAATANNQEDVLDDNYDKISWVFPACGYTQDACNDNDSGLLPPPTSGQGILMDISHLAVQTVYQVVLLRNTATGMGPFPRIAASRSFVIGQSNQDCGLALGEAEDSRRFTR